MLFCQLSSKVIFEECQRSQVNERKKFFALCLFCWRDQTPSSFERWRWWSSPQLSRKSDLCSQASGNSFLLGVFPPHFHLWLLFNHEGVVHPQSPARTVWHWLSTVLTDPFGSSLPPYLRQTSEVSISCRASVFSCQWDFVVVKSLDFGFRPLQAQFCHLHPEWHWSNYLTFPHFGFLICKIKIISCHRIFVGVNKITYREH